MVITGAVAFTACSFGGQSENALDQAAAKTRAARTAKVVRTLTIAGYGAYRTTGLVDISEQRGRYTSNSFRLAEVVDGDTSYVRLPNQRKWIKTTGWDRRMQILYGDPSAWLEGLAAAEDVEQLGSALYSGTIDGVEFQVRLDPEGRARRIRYRDQTNAAVAIDFAEWGVRVNVEIPGAADTITVDEFQGQQKRELRQHCENPRSGSDLAVCNLFQEGELD